MALCEVVLTDGSDFVAKEMEFGQGWNSPSHTSPLFVILQGISAYCKLGNCKVNRGNSKQQREV